MPYIFLKETAAERWHQHAVLLFTFQMGGYISNEKTSSIAFPGERDKNLIFLTTNLSFDEIGLKSEVKLFYNYFNVMVINANGTRSHLNLSNFALWNLDNFAKICM